MVDPQYLTGNNQDLNLMDFFRMTLVDYTFEDEQLFNLLKRQYRHRVPSEFEYLVNTRVTPNKKEYIFEQRDENGCILLHYAAQGGNTLILDEILTSYKILNKKCIRGQSALHFAIKQQQTDMIEHLIEIHSEKRNPDEEKTPIHKETKTDCDIVRGEFSPVHLAAWFDNTRLLKITKRKQQNNAYFSLKVLVKIECDLA